MINIIIGSRVTIRLLELLLSLLLLLLKARARVAERGFLIQGPKQLRILFWWFLSIIIV